MKVKDKRIHRKIRIRKKISGTSKVPRLAVFKSNNNIYVQAIDDLNQVTIASASTLSKEVKTKNSDILFHSDVVQAVSSEKLDFHKLGIDSAAVSGHKIGGPKGIGALYISNNIKNLWSNYKSSNWIFWCCVFV